MEEIVYLRTGQKAILSGKLNNQFIVYPFYEYEDYDGNIIEGTDKNVISVDEVFKSPPTPVIDEEYSQLTKKIDGARHESIVVQNELYQAKNELANVQKQTTDLSKFIINRSEFRTAKRITLFTENEFMPSDYTESKHGMKISSSMKLLSGEEHAWHYEFGEEYISNSKNIDLKWGFLFDKTDEEIEAVTIERIKSYKPEYFHKYGRSSVDLVDDKYLTEELKEEKRQLIDKKNIEKQEATEKKILELEEQLKNLKEGTTRVRAPKGKA